MKPDLFPVVRDLRANFPAWDPIQRGLALARYLRDGLTKRTLAKMVNVSEGSVRNYVLLLRLSPADHAAIKAGAPMRPYIDRLRSAEQLARFNPGSGSKVSAPLPRRESCSTHTP